MKNLSLTQKYLIGFCSLALIIPAVGSIGSSVVSTITTNVVSDITTKLNQECVSESSESVSIFDTPEAKELIDRMNRGEDISGWRQGMFD